MKLIPSNVVNTDLQNIMQNINPSTWLLFGENDRATPLEQAKKMEKLISDAFLANDK